jgi:hypothetical protein
MTRAIPSDRDRSISFLLDQNPNVASVGFGGAVVERAEIKGTLLTSRNNFVTRQTFNMEDHAMPRQSAS